MLSAMAQSSAIMKNSSKNHYKSEFRNRFIPEPNLQQFDFKTWHKLNLRSTSSKTQKLDSIISVEWDSTTSQWENSYKEEYTYDASGNITVEIDREKDSTTNQWENSYKYEYTYDANGNMTVVIYSEWNDTTSQWENSYKEENTYDANDNMTVEIYSEWNSSTSQWENSSMYEFTCDANGNLTVAISSVWFSSTSQWVNSNKHEYTYDANGNMTDEISSLWLSSTSQWENTYKGEYTYDANSNRTIVIYSDWNSTTSQWENWQKFEYTYDANGNMTVEIDSEWNSTTNQWENSYKYEFTYDLAYLNNDLILPFFYDFSVNKLTAITTYGYDGTTWANLHAETFKYSDITSVPEVNNIAYTVYPNPASEYVTFDISEPTINSKVDIFTVQGKRILSQSLNDKTVDVSALPKGIYFYQLSIDGKFSNGKIVIK